MPGRYYFHLFDSETVIRDDFGAVALDLADAHEAAAEIIKEFQAGQGNQKWQDWKLVVTDDTAEFALVLSLGNRGQRRLD